MRTFIGRLLGYEEEIRSREEETRGEIRERQIVEAQRDSNKQGWEVAVQAANIHAKRNADLTELLESREERLQEAAGLVRGAHRQLNLKHSSRSAQDMTLKAARLLEGNK